MRRLRALVLVAVFALGATGVAGSGLSAQDAFFFRIGTGSTAGTYYPIGSIIASAISNPPGSRPCDQGGSCGVPGLIAVVQSTNGSCLLYTSPSPRDQRGSRMPSSA